MCEREDIRFNNAYSLQEITTKIQNDQLEPGDLLGQNFGFNLISFGKLLESLTFNFLNIFDYSYIYKNDKNSEIENSMRIFHHHGSRLMDLETDLETDLDPNQSLIHSISYTIKDAASKIFVSRFFKLFHENNPSINLNIFLENSKKVVDIPEIYNSILDQFPFDMIMKFLLTRTGVKFNNDFLQHDTDYIIENIEDFYVDKGDMIYVSKDIIRDEIISEKIIIRTQMITGNYIISKLDLSQIPNQEYEGRVYIKIVKSNEFYSYKEKVIILIYLGFYEEASKMILNGKDENYFTPDELRDHNFEVFRQNQSSFPDLIIKMFPKL